MEYMIIIFLLMQAGLFGTTAQVSAAGQSYTNGGTIPNANAVRSHPDFPQSYRDRNPQIKQGGKQLKPSRSW